MPITIDDTALLRGLERMAEAHEQAITRGLRRGASRAEAILQGTHAHGDVTGATRDSYRVYADVDAERAAASGYAAAQSALAAQARRGFTVEGGAKRQTFYRLKQGERGVGYASFTDYQDSLEKDNGGQKAALGPTLQETASGITQDVAEEIRRAR
jgi:hypothetical protein